MVSEREGAERDEPAARSMHLVNHVGVGAEATPGICRVGEALRAGERESGGDADSDNAVAAPQGRERVRRVSELEQLVVRRHHMGDCAQASPGRGRIWHLLRLLGTRHLPRPLTANPGRALTRLAGVTRADLSKTPRDVAAMFDGVARGYDRTNTVLSGGNATLWRIATVRAVDPKRGERSLDIAAGTGTSSAALARTGATVIALDFSAGMVEEGRRRHPDLTFVQGDAEKLPFDDDEFDAVTISFGLRNVQHPDVALAEMYRVLKPGGRVVVCEFSRPPMALLRGAYQLYLKHVMPIIAGAASSNPSAYRYLFESIDAWPEQGVLSQWLRAAGFTRVGYRNLSAGVVALHRGHKPADAQVRASRARRRAPRPSTAAGETAE